MTDLFWALLVIAVLLVAAIYAFETMRRKRRVRRPVGNSFPASGAPAGSPARDADADLNLGDLSGIVPEEDDSRPAGIGSSPPEHGKAPGMTLVFTVITRDGTPILHSDLAAELDNQDMRWQENGVFAHFGVGDRSTDGPLFVAANIIEPGTFPREMESDDTPGIALIAQLPGAVDAPVVLELMIEVGHALAERLDAVFGDERRNPLTPQALNHLREQAMEFERKRLLSAQSL